jgi:hypothetical protein
LFTVAGARDLRICAVIYKRFIVLVILVGVQARNGDCGSLILVVKELAHSCRVVGAISVNVFLVI